MYICRSRDRSGTVPDVFERRESSFTSAAVLAVQSAWPPLGPSPSRTRSAAPPTPAPS
jgi:hypothetical protein